MSEPAAALLSAVFTRELPTETIEVDGRRERHVVGCYCTTKVMRWPCQDVTP